MFIDKYKKIIAAFIFAFVTVSVFAADTSALVKKQLTAAEDAMDEGDVETAYKKVNLDQIKAFQYSFICRKLP